MSQQLCQGRFQGVISDFPSTLKKLYFYTVAQRPLAYPVRLNHRDPYQLRLGEACKLNIDFTCEQHENSAEASASFQVIVTLILGVSLTMVHTRHSECNYAPSKSRIQQLLNLKSSQKKDIYTELSYA